MEKISNYINLLFQKLFDQKEHPVYSDMVRVNQISKEYSNYKEKYIEKKIEYNPSLKLPKHLELNINSESDRFDMDAIKNLSEEMKKNNSFNKILELVNVLYNQYIPSNNIYEEDLKNNLRTFSKNNRINIAILGAGPVGLFLACYLHKYYNSQYGLNDQPRVGIVIFDNKIVNRGLRKPYTRKRNFAFSSSFFSYIIPKIYSWNNDDKQEMFINIYVLEYLLFTRAYYDYNIPFIFDEYTWEEYCDLFEVGDFKAVFDCTGGRLKPPIFKDLDTSWISKILSRSKNPPFKLEIDTKMNLVKINLEKDKFIKNYYYINFNVFDLDTNNKLNLIDNFDFNIENKSDLKLFINIKRKFYSFDDLNTIFSKVNSHTIRNFLYNIIPKTYGKSNYIYQFDVFNTNIRHSISVSSVVNYNDHKFIYIGAGDSIFHGHFITGAGLNRTIGFAVKCANFITNLSLKDKTSL